MCENTGCKKIYGKRKINEESYMKSNSKILNNQYVGYLNSIIISMDISYTNLRENIAEYKICVVMIIRD